MGDASKNVSRIRSSDCAARHARNITAALQRYAPEGAREMTMRAGDRTRWAPAPEFVRRSG